MSSILSRIKSSIGGLFSSESPNNIGVYGPPNGGKTTLTNRIVREQTEYDDESDLELGSENNIPHETRRAMKQDGVEIQRNGSKVSFDIVDTPGVDVKVDYEEFVEHGIEEGEAKERSREATEGVAEAMKWLREDIEGVIYVIDSTRDPISQVNTMIMGIIESQDLPTVIIANKTDLEDSNVKRIENAYPQHPVVPASALEGENMDQVYDALSEHLG